MISNGKRRTKRILILLAAVILAAAGLWIDNNRISVSSYTTYSEKLPDDYSCRIVQISDLHSKSFGEDNRRLKQAVEKQHPDIVVITGDIINANEQDTSTALSLCGWLANAYPTYYVVGNHELDRPYSEYTAFLNALSDTGTEIIDNRRVFLTEDGSVRLYGLYTGDWNCCYSESDADYSEVMLPDKVTNLIGVPDESCYNIIITHSPDFFQRNAAWGADLVFAGHIHGGMIRLPFFGGLFSPGFSFFPKYDAGEYTIDNSHMIVSRGLGNSVGIRIFNPPELVCVTLERG